MAVVVESARSIPEKAAIPEPAAVPPEAAKLIALGLTPDKARTLCGDYPDRIAPALALLAQRKNVRSPAAFVLTAIQQDWRDPEAQKRLAQEQARSAAFVRQAEERKKEEARRAALEAECAPVEADFAKE